MVSSELNFNLSVTTKRRTCYHYMVLTCSKVVTVMEEQTTISSGTTGLRTWEASFWLAEYLIAHPEILAKKNVVDIGCGVGFLGIACALLGAKKVVLTDGNTDVLTMARQNIGYSNLLDWEDFTQEQIAALNAEVLILSDLTYDPTNIVPLVNVLKAILVKGVSAYMSSAIRNPQTFVDFFARIKQECVGVEIEEISLKDGEHLFFFDEETVQTVKVFHLSFP
ncbi:hypothetical protein BGZ51_001259 [Haplosporangium sp. Z 767]|nr:hypothetical protein BGZ51_001259 [Haplosporangium sp. Z 767]